MEENNTPSAHDPIEDDRDPKEVPFIQKEAADRLFRSGSYAEAIKCYSKALLAVKLLVKNNEIDSGKLINEYAKQVIVCISLT